MQVADAVAPALLAEAPEIAQVFPYLRWGNLQLLPELLGEPRRMGPAGQPDQTGPVVGESIVAAIEVRNDDPDHLPFGPAQA